MSRVLEVRKGTICYVVGTVYMEMMMKPSALRDLSKQVSGKRRCYRSADLLKARA